MSREAQEKLILTILLMGFVTIFFEIRYEHRYLLEDSSRSLAWIPVIASGMLAFASIVGYFPKKIARGFAMGIFALGAAVGAYGVFLHSGGQFTKIENLVLHVKPVAVYDDTTAKQDTTGSPPLLAPMSIGGLSLVGLVTLAGKAKAK